MLAENSAATDRGNADLVLGTYAATRGSVCDKFGILGHKLLYSLCDHKRGAAGCIELVAVVLFDNFNVAIAAESGIGAYFGIMLKAVAISLCCKAGAEICRDCGENSLASKLELAGKAGILLLSLPLLGGILSMAKDML